jgi:AcrR family transcriptional regulator
MSVSNEAPPAVPVSPQAISAKPRVRDRILETACDLFYKRGIREVGVDRIATEAGTNKMSFYRSFESKDDLVAEYLEQMSGEFWAWWDGIVTAHGDARLQIEALFDALMLKDCLENSRGCPLANASVELVEEDHPGRQVAFRQKTEIRRRFRELAAKAGAARSEELGDALMLLMEGGYLSRQTFGSGKGPMQTAARAARVLLDAYTAAGGTAPAAGG